MKHKDLAKIPLVIKTNRNLFQQLSKLIKDQVIMADASIFFELENESLRHSYPLKPIDATTFPFVLYQGKFSKLVELKEVLVEYASTSVYSTNSEYEKGSLRQSYPIESS